MKKLAFTLLAATQLLALACDSQTACQKAYPGHPSLERACRRGADEFGPRAKGQVKTGAQECENYYARKEIPIGDADAGVTLYDPDRDVTDLYQACLTGVSGHLVVVEGQDAGKVRGEACEQFAAARGTRCYK